MATLGNLFSGALNFQKKFYGGLYNNVKTGLNDVATGYNSIFGNQGGEVKGAATVNNPAPVPNPANSPKSTTVSNVPAATGGGGTTRGILDQMSKVQLGQNQDFLQQNLGLVDKGQANLQQNFLGGLVSQFGYDQASQIARQYGLSIDPSMAGTQGAAQAAVATNTDAANLSKADLNAAFQQYLGTADAQKAGVNEAAAAGAVQTEDALRRNFGARNALDSTFYANALSTGVSKINQEKIQQLGQINTSIQQAQQRVTSEKAKVDQQLQSFMADLENKKLTAIQDAAEKYRQGLLSLEELRNSYQQDATKYANDVELKKLETLANIQMNLDTQARNYAGSAQALQDEFTKLTGVNASAPEAVRAAAQGALYIAQNPNGGRDAYQQSLLGAGADQATTDANVRAAEAFISTNPKLQQLITSNGGKL